MFTESSHKCTRHFAIQWRHGFLSRDCNVKSTEYQLIWSLRAAGQVSGVWAEAAELGPIWTVPDAAESKTKEQKSLPLPLSSLYVHSRKKLGAAERDWKQKQDYLVTKERLVSRNKKQCWQNGTFIRGTTNKQQFRRCIWMRKKQNRENI